MEGLIEQMDWKGGWDGEREDFRNGGGIENGEFEITTE